MAWSQLVTPITSTVGQAGWCLVYVRTAFGAPAGYSTAFSSWQGAQQRDTAHADRNYPTNVSFPVYFTWNNAGHVVWYNAPDGLFYSTPTSGSGHQTFKSIEAVEAWLSTGNGKYLGWAEDVNGRRVIQQVADAPSGNTQHSGFATVVAGPLHVRNQPNPSSPAVATYVNGQTFSYDSYIDTNGYRYLSYISFSGVRRYVAEYADSAPNTKFVNGGV